MPELIDEFFDFLSKRQKIWHRRFILKGAYPWTEDTILQKYKILNVYRELDKGTQYIIRKMKGVRDRRVLLLNLVFYRFFNKYDLYEKLGMDILKDFSPETLKMLRIKLLQLKEKGEPLFNDAYLIAGKIGEEKYISVIKSLSWLWRNIDSLIRKIDSAKSPEESFARIKRIPLVGNFLAYEVWTDLTYFGFFEQNWSDNDFVNVGPGASWGLKIIFGPLNKKDELMYLKKLHKLQVKTFCPEWKEIFYRDAFSNKPFLSLRNIEHSLCEFRKYYNLKNGKGKRRLYKSF